MGKAGAIESVSAARWLVGVIGSVVVCFLLAIGVAEYLESAIAARSADIIGNAMPSVKMLSGARGDLRSLDIDLDHHFAAPADQRSQIRDRIVAAQQNVEGSLAAYKTLPFFESERHLYGHVDEHLAILEKLLPAYLSSASPEALASLHHELNLTDESIQRVVSFDATQGERLGLEIEQIRGRTRSLVALLVGLSVILAIGAVYLALRQLRRVAAFQQAEREALEKREHELAVQNEALGEFAGRVAHDVLSPLSTALLALELVRGACENDAAARRATERGIAAVTRVHALVDALLAFSRGGGQPEPGAVTEIAPVIADVVDGLSGQAAERGISLVINPVPQGSAMCSKGVLTSLLSNLIRNAIKYMGDAAERRIEVRALDTNGRWRIEVEDTGPGIPADQQSRIFQPYVQIRRDREGIGLGLATVDRLVRAHGGSLGVISQGRGSLFWFELPKPATHRNVEQPIGALVHARG